jgi:Secretion system C-terminal sorting domain
MYLTKLRKSNRNNLKCLLPIVGLFFSHYAYLQTIPIPKAKPVLRMEDFMGVNLREGDPIQYANCVGFAREYHEWSDDEGNHIALNNLNAQLQIENRVPVPQQYPNNRYAWNTNSWQNDKEYDNWYTNLRNSLDESVTAPIPVCATLKSCIPYLTGSNSYSIGAESEIKPAQGSTTLPESYLWYADWVYQFTKKFGSSTTNIGTFKPAPREPTTVANIGRNRVGYIELWNESNKYWLTNIPNTQFNGDEYAALTNAAFYGTKNNGTALLAQVGSAVPVPTSINNYQVGIRNADPNMRLVLGGTAGIRDFDENFVKDIKKWFTVAPHNTGAFPFDVINFHHYNSSSWDGIKFGQVNTTAIHPEADSWTTGFSANTKFKQRLKDIRTAFGTTTELWLSEFGFDTNENSPYRTPNIKDANGVIVADRQEVQGQWLLRGFMEIAAAGWDRAMQFCIRDEDSADKPIADQGVFKASGLVRTSDFGNRPKKSYYYVHSMKEILKGTLFDKELSSDPNATDMNNPRIMRFKRNIGFNSPNVFGQYTYSVWLPTANNEKVTQKKIFLGTDITGVTASLGATLVTLKVGDLNGVRTSLNVGIENGQYYVTIPEVSERPVFFILGGSQPDNILAVTSIPEVSATGVACDAIKATWTWPAGRPNVARYRVYYYEKNDSEENPTESKSFNITDKNLVLFTDVLPGVIGTTPQNEVLITGLKKTLDQYYIFIEAVDNLGVVTPINIAIDKKGWTTAKTLPCPNNIISGVSSKVATDAISVRAVNQLFNYDNVKFCYPQTLPAVSSLGQFTRLTDSDPTPISASISLNATYDLEGIALLDGNGTGDIVISAGLAGNLQPILSPYRTVRNDEWQYFPLRGVTANELQIILMTDAAQLRKIVLYGKLNTTSSLATNCPNCDAVTSTGLTIIGVDNTSVSTLSQLRVNNVLPAGSATNKKIRINGKLIIDEDYTFSNSNFSMKPSSDIRVSSEKQFNLINTTVEGCDQMWKGITIASGGRINMNGSILRDANIGLDFERGTTAYENIWPNTLQSFNLLDTRIERNVIGLQIQGKSSNNPRVPTDITSSSKIGGTFFDGTENDLKPCYAGQSQTPADCNKKSLIGLQLFDAYVLFYYPLKTNTIQNLAKGIYSTGSYIGLNSTKFKNIKPLELRNPYYDGYYFPNPTITYGGQGVDFYTGFLNQRGLGSDLLINGINSPIPNPNNQSSPFTFSDVLQPFYIYNSWFNIYGNKIDGTGQEAVYTWLNASNNYSCYFEGNYIATKANGVSLGGIVYPGHYPNYYGVEVTDNYIVNKGNQEQNSAVGNGISVTGAYTPSTSVKINRNYIQTQNGDNSIGINLSSTVNSWVSNNYINLQSFSKSALNIGFKLTNNSTAFIANNTVEGRGARGNTFLSDWANNTGFHIESSPSNTIQCNTISLNRQGFIFKGKSESTNKFKGNIIDGYYKAVTLADDATIGTPLIGAQAHMGNQWKPANSGTRVDAEWTGYPASSLNDYKFKTDPSLGGVFNPNSLIMPANWFQQITSTNGTYNCGTNTGGGLLGTNSGGLNTRGSGDDIEEEYVRFAKKDALSTLTQSKDANEWVLRRRAYRAFKKSSNPKVTAEDKKDIDQFSKKHDVSAVNDFYDFDTQMESLFDKKTNEDSRLEDAGSKIVNAIRDKPNDRISKSLSDWMQEYYTLLPIRQKKIKDDIEKLRSVNSRIKAEKPYEIFEKQVNDIHLAILDQSNVRFTVQQLTTLREIGMKCPSEAGLAPYKARSVLSLGSRERLPDWKCDEVKSPSIKNEAINNSLFSIYPNPVQNEFVLTLTEPNIENMTWEISDATGKIVKVGVVEDKYQKIDAQKMELGIYFITLKNKDKIVGSDKFIIIH